MKEAKLPTRNACASLRQAMNRSCEPGCDYGLCGAEGIRRAKLLKPALFFTNRAQLWQI